MGTVTAPQVEFQLETRRNSSESSVEGFCDLRGEEVVRERENRMESRKNEEIRDARRSMWKSDKCSTLRRFPLSFFRGGNGSGFGLENQFVRFRGGVGGNEREVDGRF